MLYWGTKLCMYQENSGGSNSKDFVSIIKYLPSELLGYKLFA